MRCFRLRLRCWQFGQVLRRAGSFGTVGLLLSDQT